MAVLLLFFRLCDPLHRGSQHGSPAFRKKKLLRSGSSKVRSVQGDISQGVRMKEFDFCYCLLDLGFRPRAFLVFLPFYGGSQLGLLAFRKKKLLSSIVRSVKVDYIWGDVLRP